MQDYARLHDYPIVVATRLADPTLHNMWNKIGTILKVMDDYPDMDWYLWIDSDAMIIDVNFLLPFQRFNGKDLIIWGNETRLALGDGRRGKHCARSSCEGSTVCSMCMYSCLVVSHSNIVADVLQRSFQPLKTTGIWAPGVYGKILRPRLHSCSCHVPPSVMSVRFQQPSPLFGPFLAKRTCHCGAVFRQIPSVRLCCSNR